MKIRYIVRVVGVILTFAVSPVVAQKASTTDPLLGFDAWVTAFLAEHHVQGMALGIVKDGKVLTTRAYGFRDTEARLPMTSGTLLAIGSITKSFTATILGMLVDEGRLNWDQPVRSYLPDFALFDRYASDNITPRDLLSHRSGLPAHNNVWFGRAISRAELVARLRYLEPTTTFRNRYQYNNLMFATAGYLAEQLTNHSWEELIQTRLLTPLGMTSSMPGLPDAAHTTPVASPYRWENGRLEKLPPRDLGAANPAGSIYSSVDDMVKYLQFRLAGGRVGTQQLVSPVNFALMETPQTPLGQNEFFEFPSYGLGVQLNTSAGHAEISHSGGIDGFAANIAWFPNDGVGIIVLTNGPDAVIPGLIKLDLRDRLLGLPRIDRAPLLRKARADAAARAAAAPAPASRVAGTRPSHDLAAYAGTYAHPGYGTMTIGLGDSGLELRYDGFVIPLTHDHFDVFSLGRISGRITPVQGVVRFRTSVAGLIDAVEIPFEPQLPHQVFTRK